MQRKNWFIMLAVLMISSLAIPVFAAEKGFSGKDKTFFKDAASGGMMEVQLGQIAKEKAQSQEVKDFASKMVTEHGKANEELKTLAQKKNMTVPDKLERKHKSMMDKVQKASGAEFDKKYMKHMVKDHTEDVKKFKEASQNVKDTELKAWADKTLPVLQQHLQSAKEIARKIGAEVDKDAGKM